MNKSELLNWLHEENRQWEAFIAQIDPQRMEQPGVAGEWSIKDIIAHLTLWQPRLIAGLQAAQRGQPEPPPPWPAHLTTDDEINAWIYAKARERSVDEILAETQQLFQQLLAVINDLPDEVLIETERRLVHLDGKRFPAGEFFDHFHDDHEAELRAWLAQTGSWKMDLPAILISQYLASLEMLKQTITQCPPELWNAAQDKNRFWQVAYHALYFTHEYLADSYESFVPWEKHREVYDFDERLEDQPVFEPYDREAILEYLAFCQQHVAERVPRLNLEGREGHGGGEFVSMELQIYSIRHLMQHTGELMERLAAHTDAAVTGAQVDWVGSKHA